jgi:hypothetical protein
VPTPSLRELQRLFWHALADDPGSPALAPGLVEVAEPSARLDVQARLGVYANAYVWRLRDVLAEDFPEVARLLGPDRFEEVVREYLRHHPSEHPSVRYVGGELASFLETRCELPAYLPDLARLEWARTEVFDAPDATPVTAAALLGVAPEDWPRLRLRPIPALTLLRTRWPVHEIWDGAQPADPAGPATLAAAPTILRVWRAADYAVFHAAMDARAADALERLMAAEPFATICGAFAELPPDAAAREATALLARWFEDGIIARVE